MDVSAVESAWGGSENAGSMTLPLDDDFFLSRRLLCCTTRSSSSSTKVLCFEMTVAGLSAAVIEEAGLPLTEAAVPLMVSLLVIDKDGVVQKLSSNSLDGDGTEEDMLYTISACEATAADVT